LVVGASFLAVGVAASAATANQIVAGVVAFTLLLLLSVIGEIYPAISVRAHLAAFARGEVPLAPIVLYAALAVAALAAAAALRRVVPRRGAGARALATVGGGVGGARLAPLAIRHPRELDVPADRAHTLDRETIAVLDRVSAPIELAILRPTRDVFDPL